MPASKYPVYILDGKELPSQPGSDLTSKRVGGGAEGEAAARREHPDRMPQNKIRFIVFVRKFPILKYFDGVVYGTWYPHRVQYIPGPRYFVLVLYILVPY